MAAKKPASTKAKSQYRVVKRADGRWAVRLKGGKFLHGLEKAKALFEAGKIPAPKTKAKTEEAPAG
jgi:hypothetical protein